MTLVSDPDDLDRFQILVDPEAETVRVRGLGDDRTEIHTNGDTTNTANDEFTDPDTDVDFTADGVIAGDILTIASGTGLVINHYVIEAIINTQVLQVAQPGFPAQLTGLTYKISAPTPIAGPNGGTVGDGVTGQALYSFLKEEWRTLSVSTVPDLIAFTFPLESITREQFEIGGPTHGDWDWADDDTRDLIRTAGWAQIDSAGLVNRRYAGVITLGSLDANAQVYYLQGSAEGRVPTSFVLAGAVNQAVLVFEDTTSDDDNRAFLTLFVRKKGRTYAQSAIADIGVVSLETLVNRFPLTHANDPAVNETVVVTDGEISGAGVAGTDVFQEMTTVDASQTDGVAADATLTDGVFEFTSALSTFLGDGLEAKDTLEMTDGSDQGTFEIVSVDDNNTLKLKQEPRISATGTEFITITGGAGIAFTTRTRIRVIGVSASLSPLSDDTGTLVDLDTDKDFIVDGVIAGDMVQIKTTAAVEGVYKIVSVDDGNQLTIDLTDQPFAGEVAQEYTIYKKGMHLQRKSTLATQVADLQFIEDGGGAGIDTIARLDSGDFVADGWTHGMCATVSGSVSNDGSYVVDEVQSDELVLIAADSTLTNETALLAVTVDGANGIVRTLNSVDFPFNWRLFGNNGTLAECFKFIQKELRRGRGSGEVSVDIDAASPVQRGDTGDAIMSFASPTGTTLNMFIDDLNTTDINNATFNDLCGTGRQEAFVAGVTITLNSNLTGDIPASGTNKTVVFFTTNPGGNFGTQDAIIVNDANGVPMSFEDQSSDISTSFDYDNNIQGGRSIEDAAITIVAIGQGTAQYVQVTGTIQRVSSNTFAVVAALERNYSNP